MERGSPSGPSPTTAPCRPAERTLPHFLRAPLSCPLVSTCVQHTTDNGGEFLNHILIPWCRNEQITFTRGRPYRKNDQAYVEQKNWSVLRRVIGYARFGSRDAFLALDAVHQLLRPYVNFFQPLRKLVSKERHGARVLKRYDRAQTPYRRVLASGVLTAERTAALADEYHRLNPRQLRTDLEIRLDALWKLAER